VQLLVYCHKLHRYRGAQQVEYGFGKVYPFLETHNTCFPNMVRSFSTIY